jgi:hypothetical protein
MIGLAVAVTKIVTANVPLYVGLQGQIHRVDRWFTCLREAIEHA